jgi:PAS domain S-box-containing protein
MLAFDLILNLCLIVTISVLSGFLDRSKYFNRVTILGKIAQGLLFGATAIVGMVFPFELAPGLIFDGRPIIISLCTLFFGPISGAIAATMAFFYRLLIGGVGLPMGIATILEAFLVGLIFYRIKQRHDIFRLTTGRLYLFGLIVHLILALLILVLPSRYAKQVLDEVALTIVLVYPLITTLIGKILYDQEVASRYMDDLAQREMLYRTTLYSIGDAVITTDSTGAVINMNSEAANLTGWKESEARGKKLQEIFNIVNEFTLQPVENPVDRVLREGKVVGLANHTLLISRDGRKIPIADSGAPIRGIDGKILGVVLVFRDQTKERENLRQIEEQEKRYRQFVYSSNDGIWRFDLAQPVNINLSAKEQIQKFFEGGYLAECNDVYAQMYGFQNADEILGIKLSDVLDPNDRSNWDYLEDFIKNGYRLTGGISKEFDKEGNVKYFENNLVGIVENGYLIRAWGTQKDITEKYILEQKIRESEEKFRLLAEASLAGIYLIQDMKFAYVNKALADIFGYDVEEIVGKLGPLDLTHPDFHQDVIENTRKRVSGEVESINYSFKGVRKDGKEIWVEVYGRRIEYQNKVGIIGTLLDITEKVRLEEENRVKTEQLKSTLELTPNVAIQMYDIEGKVTYWNTASEKIYCWTKEEAIGKTLDQLIFTREEALEFKKILLDLASTGSPYGPFESKYRAKDGSEGWILSTTFAVPSLKDEKVFVCMYIDITDQKIALMELDEERNLFQTLIETTPAAIIVHRGKDLMFCNRNLSTLTGYSLEELYAMPLWDLVHPDQREQVKSYALARMEGGDAPSLYEMKVLRKNGEVLWIYYSVRVFEWKGQRTAIGIGFDITERKFNEEMIKIQYNIAHALVVEKTLYKFFELVRDELSKIIDTANLFVAFYDENTDELYSPFEWDEKMDAPVRWSAKKSLTGKVVKEQRTLFLRKEDIQKLVQSGDVELIGSLAECWLGVPLVVNNKSYGAIVVQSYDNPNAFDQRSVKILEVVATQLSVYVVNKMQTEELNKLSLAVERSQVGIIITDRNGIIEYVNPKFTEITGYSIDEAIGKTPRIFKSGYHTIEFYKNLWDTILSGKEWVGEFRNKKKNGELYWDKTRISPIFNENGVITHFVGIKEDVTEQKRLIEELVEAKQKAIESERLKTAFLGNISHEVRTPLNGLLGFAQLLEAEKFSPQEVKQFAGIIVKKANELLSLFNEILDLSLIESNQMKIVPKPTNINQVLFDVYSTFLVDEKVRNKVVELRIGTMLPDGFEFNTDAIRLKQILNNLVENGLKFTKRGFVEFGAKLRDDGDVEFYVKDTGIGIPKSQFDSIFEGFRQVDTDIIRREYEGAGIGLSLCKGLVTLLGGKIWVESELGEGSTFYFTIAPLGKVERKEQPMDVVFFKAKDVNFEDKLVFLVAEDDYINYVILEKLLSKRYNCEILHASTGKDAIDIVRTRKDIDLILLDIRLPIVDGYTAFEEIRKENPTVPIIAVTAYAYSEDRKKILQMGFDEYVSKPFDVNLIISKINDLLIKRKKGLK